MPERERRAAVSHRRTLTARGSKRRRQLLDTGARLFAEQGYHGTTVGQVCDALGVGKGVFYWYFDSKEALFRELLQRTLLELRRAQHAAIGSIGDPVARIESGARASIEFFVAEPGRLHLIRIAGQHEEFSAHVTSGEATVAADVAVHIKEGMAAGSIRPGDPDVMAHGVLGAILHFVETYLGTPEAAAAAPRELADEAVAFCLRGVLAR
jgi:AcrR family transcriptional regulator